MHEKFSVILNDYILFAVVWIERGCCYDIYGTTSKTSSVFHNARLTENDLTLL
jgi:hypothetical protein